MKKLVSTLAIVLAFTMLMSITSFAATFNVDTDADYDTTKTTVEAGEVADSIAVTSTTTAGNYYGILLVEGEGLPTDKTPIRYIDQKTAGAGTTSFNVLPNMDDVNEGDSFTLYVSSNEADAELVSVKMTYGDKAPAVIKGAEILPSNEDGKLVLEKDPANANFKNEYTNVAVFEATLGANVGYSEAGFIWVKDNVETANKFAVDAEVIEGGGEFTYGVAMYAIPDGVKITAIPYYVEK